VSTKCEPECSEAWDGLTEFSIQPKMDTFIGNNNELTTFPIQPNMRMFEGKNNRFNST